MKRKQILSGVFSTSGGTCRAVTVVGIGGILLFTSGKGIAQDALTSLGSWNLVSVGYRPSARWTLLAEGCLRSLRFYDWFHYYEGKGAVFLRVTETFTTGLGAGLYHTYREGGNFRRPMRTAEVRLWPQAAFNQPLGPLSVDHRYRVEVRFTTQGVRERFRQRFGVSYPFGPQRTGYKMLRADVHNELFFTTRAPYFERTRLQIQLGVKPSLASTFQVGYVFQFDYNLQDEIGRNFFMVGYYLMILRKKVKNPSSSGPEDQEN